MGGLTVGKFGERFGHPFVRVDAADLQFSMSMAIIAQLSPPSSEPANMAFLRFNARGRMERSTVLESRSMRPSSMNRDSPSQVSA